jgi:hypothetical protein
MRLKHVRFRDSVIFPGAPAPGASLEADTRRVGRLTWDAGFVGVELRKNDGHVVVFRVPFSNVLVAEELVGADDEVKDGEGGETKCDSPVRRGGWPKGKPRKTT